MSLALAIRRAVVSADERLPLDRVGPLEQQMTDSISTERFGAVLVELFAALALSLGAVGVYGVMAYAVAQRRQEVGIRMVLGASRGAVLGMFLQEAARLAVAGLGVGVLATLALTRCLQNILLWHPIQRSAGFVGGRDFPGVGDSGCVPAAGIARPARRTRDRPAGRIAVNSHGSPSRRRSYLRTRK